MAGVFLSYDRDDATKARPIAAALEKAGHSVWWDLHVRGGAQFAKVIEEALKAADVVVVLWSANSVESAWVRDEAAAGRDSGRLVPATIDGTDPPLGFRQFQTIDLTDWRRCPKGRGCKELEHAIEGFNATAAANVPPPGKQAARLLKLNPWLVGTAFALILSAAAYALWPSTSARAVPTVTVLPASNAAAAQALSRDLFGKLGNLQTSNSNSLQLVEQDAGIIPDLIFKVDGATTAANWHASLLLLSGRTHSLLWSGEYEQPADKGADLKQQLAFSAANVLLCASDAYGSVGHSLDAQTRQLYLDACGDLTQTGKDAGSLVSRLREVTSKAPGFAPGWGRLLEAEQESVFGPPYDRDWRTALVGLRADIAAARKIDPELPEGYVIEAEMLGRTGSFTDPVRLLDRAVDKNPDNPSVLVAHASALAQVGRMKAAVNEARRAVQIVPFSPRAQETLISALIYAGQFAAAQQELARAETFFPGATNLISARYRLDLRYGSAQKALMQLQSGQQQGYPGQESFLRARIDPSPANIDRAIQEARNWLGSAPVAPGEYIQALAAFGRNAALMNFLMHMPRQGNGTSVLFRPSFHDFWRDPDSLKVARRLGLLDYWRESGRWPDFCSWPDLPYDCKKEAAKLGA